jgi:hypothetical protein
VVDALVDQGAPPPLVFDAARLAAVGYTLDAAGLEIDEDGDIARLEAGRGWIRRFSPPAWRDDQPPRSYAGALRSSWYALLTSALLTLDVEWLTPLERLSLAEQKLFQAKAARELAILTPDTVVVSDPERVPAEFGRELVVKPLGPGSFVDDEGQTRVVYTNVLDRDDERLAELRGAPFLIQRRVPADTHLRVVTVRDRAWVCALSGANEFDWRRDDAAHDSFVAAEGYDDVATQARALASALSVGYSSQDWIVDGDRRVFLDLNPGGQWLFLPSEVATPVTAAIVDWLGGGA